jgi:hypothetical protein
MNLPQLMNRHQAQQKSNIILVLFLLILIPYYDVVWGLFI